MPFWSLAPAQKLAAKYDFSSKRLILAAQGYVGNYSSGMQFDRIQMPNELLFQLSDWQMGAGPKVPYKHSQSFDIDLPNRAFLTNHVTIETLSGSRTIQISGLPIIKDEAAAEEEAPQSTTSSKSNATKNGSKLIRSEPILEDLIIVHKKQFQITTTTFVKDHPSALLDISLKFDLNFFELHTTTAQSNPISRSTTLTYTFSSLQTGTSQILIRRIIQTLVPQLETTTYNIDIDLPSHPTFIPSSHLTKLLRPQSQRPSSFLERVITGYEAVRRKFPKAQLLEVDASPVRLGVAVSSPMEFVILRLTLSPCDGEDRTVTISSSGWNDWEEPEMLEFATWDLMPITIPDGVGGGKEYLEDSGDEREGAQSWYYWNEDDVCKNCGGVAEGHAPSCDGGKEMTLREEKEGRMAKEVKSHASNSKRETHKSTSYKSNSNPTKNQKQPPFLDILKAFEILTSTTTSNKKVLLTSCNLRYPMYPGFSEPYYVFTLRTPIKNSLYIGIGAVNGGVRVFGGGQGAGVRRLSDAGQGTVGFGVGETGFGRELVGVM